MSTTRLCSRRMWLRSPSKLRSCKETLQEGKVVLVPSHTCKGQEQKAQWGLWNTEASFRMNRCTLLSVFNTFKCDVYHSETVKRLNMNYRWYAGKCRKIKMKSHCMIPSKILSNCRLSFFLSVLKYHSLPPHPPLLLFILLSSGYI